MQSPTSSLRQAVKRKERLPALGSSVSLPEMARLVPPVSGEDTVMYTVFYSQVAGSLRREPLTLYVLVSCLDLILPEDGGTHYAAHDFT